jgi:hypothetical protein
VANRDPWSWTELWKEYRDGPKARGVEFDDFLYERMLKLRQINSELLAACQAVEHLVATEYREGNGMAVMQRVRAAIAKATAEE